jgi:hypothetical protein
MPGGSVSHHQSRRAECAHSRLMQLRKKRNKSNKASLKRSSTVRSAPLDVHEPNTSICYKSV